MITKLYPFDKVTTPFKIGLSANTTSEWLNGFTTLKNDKDFYTTCGLNGRKLIEKDYSASFYTPAIISHFKKLLT